MSHTTNPCNPPPYREMCCQADVKYAQAPSTAYRRPQHVELLAVLAILQPLLCSGQGLRHHRHSSQHPELCSLEIRVIPFMRQQASTSATCHLCACLGLQRHHHSEPLLRMTHVKILCARQLAIAVQQHASLAVFTAEPPQQGSAICHVFTRFSYMLCNPRQNCRS